MPERYSAWIRNTICIACIAIMALVGLSACAGQSTPGFQNQNPIKIGFSYSTSSDFSADGRLQQAERESPCDSSGG